MKDELSSRIMKEFIALMVILIRSKEYRETYNQKRNQIPRLQRLPENKRAIFKSQQRFRSELHNVFIKIVNKIALSVSDDNRI